MNLLKTTRIIYRQFSSSQKIINAIEKSKKSLPELSFFEQTLKIAMSIVTAPFGIATVKQNHIVSYFTFGKYDGFRLSGLTWIPPFSHAKEVFCGDITLTHNNMHLTDSTSNPIRVSSFVIYNIINPVNNIVNLDSNDVLANWIENIIRDVISTHSYNELTINSKEKLNEKLIQIINSDIKAEFYGVEIQKAGLLEINYAPEIAETMLVKQKAKATVEARKELVDATMHLIEDISNKLDNKLTSDDKSKLITCLTVSMIGNSSPIPVVKLN
jgi:regulator of protease activity HflC (stomatin/prohibitin superfamily)